MDELVCRCTIIRAFKAPFTTNTVTITFLLEKSFTYEGKTFLVFAGDAKPGFRPHMGQAGLIEKGQPYYGSTGNSRIVGQVPGHLESAGGVVEYDELIKQIKVIIENEPDAPANEAAPRR